MFKLIGTVAVVCALSIPAFGGDVLSPLYRPIFAPGQIDASVSGESHYAVSIPEIQDRLVSLAKKYAAMTHVPYIWGGGRVGSKEDCAACRQCVSTKKLNLFSRLQGCEPCRRCGMDCSHFVNHLFKEAGLAYNYASSREFGHQAKTGLLSIYGFVDVGTDLSLAQPGDILVFPRHIAILIRALDSKHGDIIHATRFRDGDLLNLGGIRYETNRNLKTYRGKLKKVLRHKRLFENKHNLSQFKSTRATLVS